MGQKLGFEINVSPLAKSEIPTILEIENDSQLEPWTETAFLEEIDKPHSRLLAARQCAGLSFAPGSSTRDIVGYICFWSVLGEIQILNIAVRKDLRRRGIARKLIEAAVSTGIEENAKSVTLEVRESNLAARKLYESLGFIIVGERPNYYGVMKESAILMTLDIIDFEKRTTVGV
jgi:ribosomal-protein-alanine N-acetyltransferase